MRGWPARLGECPLPPWRLEPNWTKRTTVRRQDESLVKQYVEGEAGLEVHEQCDWRESQADCEGPCLTFMLKRFGIYSVKDRGAWHFGSMYGVSEPWTNFIKIVVGGSSVRRLLQGPGER